METSKSIKFTKDNVFKPRSDSEFTSGSKKTIIGWLQQIYLWSQEDTEGCIEMKPGWRKNYDKAESVLRKVAGLSKNESLVHWEQTVSVSRAINILKKVTKEVNK